MEATIISAFARLGLSDAVTRAVHDAGYETPSPIQSAAIGALLEGRDILGQAQTGTGKTAAFALPLLSRLDVRRRVPQGLVLTPTRELAIQVSEALRTYARHLPGFRVLPVYGGQGIAAQLAPLRHGVHVVVGTPGRILDHLRRGTLDLDGIATVVLDEADEMLRMGFVDDVRSILDRAPEQKQMALFSATLPDAVLSIARRHARDPVEIRIQSPTATVDTVTQRYWQVSGLSKLDALTRILEVEDFDATLVFVRTKAATTDLAERLEARGLSAAPLNGDMNQAMRELTVDRLRSGRLNVLVATDVAARGLNVERISHVINYDIPYDTEAYVHRIGRTARAGRTGEAVLFVAPRERRMLRAIERATGQPITPMRIPSLADVSARRVERLKAAVRDVMSSQDLTSCEAIVSEIQAERDVDPQRIAAAFAYLSQGDWLPSHSTGQGRAPRLDAGSARRGSREGLDDGRADAAGKPRKPRGDVPGPGLPAGGPDQVAPGRSEAAVDHRRRGPAGVRAQAAPGAPGPDRKQAAATRAPARDAGRADEPARSQGAPKAPVERGDRASGDSVRYRIEVGSAHGVEARNIVGVVANEAGLDGQYIGPVHIFESHSTVDLPPGMPRDLFRHLKRTWICGRQLKISISGEAPRKRERRAGVGDGAGIASGRAGGKPAGQGAQEGAAARARATVEGKSSAGARNGASRGGARRGGTAAGGRDGTGKRATGRGKPGKRKPGPKRPPRASAAGAV